MVAQNLLILEEDDAGNTHMRNPARTKGQRSAGFRHIVAVVSIWVATVSPFLDAWGKEPGGFSFAVLGHVRSDANGELSPLLDELLGKVRKDKPDMVFLTGDMIWGDAHAVVPDAAVIRADWDRLDAAMGRLGIPVHRVPGNHDIHDAVTRDIYFERYGDMPQAFSFRGSRFILINSAWTPEGNEPSTVKGQYTRGKQLGAKQIEFIRNELAESQRYDHVFLLMHHLLWFHKHETAWWRDVHPLLVGKNVRAVFGGDFGPMKFSHMRRDGIDYIQSSIEGIPSIPMLRALNSSRLLSQQFDNYLHTTVKGSEVAIEVKTLGEMSLGKFTPEQWRAVDDYEPPKKPLMKRLFEQDNVLGSPRRIAAVALVVVLCFVSGFIAALVLKRIQRS